jgi:hypothetical protein
MSESTEIWRLNRPRQGGRFISESWQTRFHRYFSTGGSSCWEWTGARHSDGYGVIHAEGRLRRGHGIHPRDGACLLDAVSYLEYGTLGDHPECVCPVIAAFGRGINDAMSDEGRQRLRVFIPRLVGTVDPDSEQARAEYLAWQAIRVFAPLALEAAGFKEQATALRNFEGSLQDAPGRCEPPPRPPPDHQAAWTARAALATRLAARKAAGRAAEAARAASRRG